jgi:hypothetical protein
MNHDQPEAIKVIDRHALEIMEGLANAPVYKKQGEVRAQIAKGGEGIVTKLADGTVETKNTAKAGDAIITNPGGEQYIIDGNIFVKKYQPKIGEEGVFIAKGYCKAIDNPFNSVITIMASWGERQNGAADCKLADTYDPETEMTAGEPYIIARAEFEQTYKKVI